MRDVRNRTWLALVSCGLALFTATGARAEAPDHPIVAGFERVHRDGDDPVAAGRLLLGELNCTSCHDAGASADRLLPKKAPVLDKVGRRARPEWIQFFLMAGPHEGKPGTTMPDMLAHLKGDERIEAVEALTHYLASTGEVAEAPLSGRAVEAGKQAFHRVGCVACHAPSEPTAGEAPAPAPVLATSVPLGDVVAKYSIQSLQEFLINPLVSRPSGRMPAMGLDAKAAGEIAAYLLRDGKSNPKPNLKYRYYEGDWQKLPDFETLTPVATGESVGFDLGVIRRDDGIAVVYDGFLRIDNGADYEFSSTSDDGSKVWIDGKEVVDNDGIHAPTTKSGKIALGPGVHRLRAAVFDGGAGQELSVEFTGGGLSRRPVDAYLYLDEDGPGREAKETENRRFRVDPAIVPRGRALFASLGCASCHRMTEEGSPIAPAAKAGDLASLVGKDGGCLAEEPGRGVPRYHLDAKQRAVLKAALDANARPGPAATPQQTIASHAVAFNCVACHKRDGIGGIEEARNPYFETTQKEMGDEGRIPPGLDGVGAKLNDAYLKLYLSEGGKDRPYMLTRMPRFGVLNVGPLAPLLAQADPATPIPAHDFGDLTSKKVKAVGRTLVGAEAFGCIKCHNFKGVQSTGVQSIDMAVMARRVRREWFARYLADPQAVRPGTRMPSFWPEGQSTLPKVLEGSVSGQIESIWQYLADGDNAQLPYGLGRDPIPLVAEGDEAVLYRAFIEGAGTRGVGVGLPGKVNYAFDANDMRLALIWQGGFMDASKHWTGRGDGFQPPLGDNVLSLPAGPTVARLDSPTSPWPKGPARDNGYRFLGYRLSKTRRPTFRYELGAVRVDDAPDAAGPLLRRTVTVTAPDAPENLYLRAASADAIRLGDDGWYVVGDELRVRVEGTETPILRQSDGKTELLVPVRPSGGKPATIVQEYRW